MEEQNQSATEITPEKAAERLKETDKEFIKLFGHGSLEVEYYKPDKADKQQPHERDEIYVVISGSGFFVNGDQRHPFEAGQVLLVPAGVVHRFEDFTEDFATWVFFYGPKGGEKG
ncbi:cupin domain-containing protein [Gracilimonas sediminicola]|uniref:Cupin domain-containing protein n=1 Tax=Gracilimonas sediminicola TaxID=2952158 RepID=A0A9X2L1Q3_9BACT|nr:cupin domain-containing protein [Gracilimonas sediminicola]MCP9290659.1 cupin domain-containing protein [Gracilimonas sediminicola]